MIFRWPSSAYAVVGCAKMGGPCGQKRRGQWAGSTPPHRTQPTGKSHQPTRAGDGMGWNWVVCRDTSQKCPMCFTLGYVRDFPPAKNHKILARSFAVIILMILELVGTNERADREATERMQ
ncbi:hypothetical protein niasHT_020846 [Heterodera trifolii]|uniref:Uncharacterized protein n=1 Tax=Heterodera trifolii TaxID=157864 RepID=A0ABD2KLJ5_9BILA